MARWRGEPFRAYLLYAARRLGATRMALAGPPRGVPDQPDPKAGQPAGERGQPGLAYAGRAEFVADLRLVQRELAGAPRQAYGELQHLLWQAETFGFHLAELEIRQHSAVHARALRELAADDAEPEQARPAQGQSAHTPDAVPPFRPLPRPPATLAP